MTDSAPFDDAFARSLSVTKRDLVDDTSAFQLGARSIRWQDAPPWPVVPGPLDDAVIETFLVDAGLTALSESAWLTAWRPRAQALVDIVLAACDEHRLRLKFPGYLTCSITPVAMLEGTPHLDDDQFDPDAGVGLVAISGEHVRPRVAQVPLRLGSPARIGPLDLVDAQIEAFRGTPYPANDVSGESITLFGQFGQLHAGPAASAMPSEATHRQLMVLRLPTP